MNKSLQNKKSPKNILTINGGSSSIKFAVFKIDSNLIQNIRGKIDRIGTEDASLSFIESNSKQHKVEKIKANNYNSAATHLLNWLDNKIGFDSINATVHRVVHGMNRTEPQIVDEKLIDELNSIKSFDPEHLPHEIELIKIFLKRLSTIPHAVCFDTAFHQTMPKVAKLLPLPRKLFDEGIRRYGFHGISYSYIFDELLKLDNKIKEKCLIIAHLGNGASMAAVKNGKSVDTSMAFTPTAGFPMSTRSGDIDPGLVLYITQNQKLSVEDFNKMINQQSGLLGISETSSDMRDLLKKESTDHRAAEAIDLFCYQIKKYIGAYSAAMGGLDTIIFTGGIGENVPVIRQRICDGLEFLGIQLEKQLNKKNEQIISNKQSKVIVRVIPTNEELMMAKMISNLLGFQTERENEHESSEEENSI
jgi:acetate kinase